LAGKPPQKEFLCGASPLTLVDFWGWGSMMEKDMSIKGLNCF